MMEATKMILDLLVIFLIVFGIARGVKKGFVQTVYHALRWLVCILLAQFLYPYVAELLKQLGLVDAIQSGLEDTLASMMNGSGNTSMIQSLPLPDFLKEILVQNDNSIVYEMFHVTTLTGYVAAYLANMAVNILSVIVLFVLLIVLTRLIGAALGILTKLPVIHSLNALLGGAAGLLLGILNVWIFGLAVFLLAIFCKWTWLSDAAAQTTLLNLFNAYNPLLKLAMNFLK